VQAVLSGLENHAYGPYTTTLPREPGRKEPRIAHLFCGPPDEQISRPPQDDKPGIATQEPTVSGSGGLEALQTELATLKSQLIDLEQRFDRFARQFD
jgi:uncharacterized protein YceH (UPF0502 family)